MNRLLCKVTVILLVLALVGTLGLSCGGGGGGGGKKTITIGYMTNLTGYASAAVVNEYNAVVDVVRYYNDEGLIPGVKLKLATWDTHLDYSRTIPGYDWLKEQGARLIITLIPQDGEILKPFAATDKIPIFAASVSTAATTPPGWVFCFSTGSDLQIVTLLKWVSENHWDYSKGIPKMGFVTEADTAGVEIEKAMREYCQAHPDKFNYVAGALTPVGTMDYTGQVQQLKGCDYISTYSLGGIHFIHDYRAAGYSRATFLDEQTFPSEEGYLLKDIGWADINGTLTACSSLTWTETEPHAMQDLARQLLQRYRPSQAQAIIDEGTGYYSGGVMPTVAGLAILQNAIAAVGGAANLSGQAIYDAAVG